LTTCWTSSAIIERGPAGRGQRPAGAVIVS
jgi:hypothetical protein